VKILLVGINAKYVQTNLAIRLLKGFASRYSQAVRSGRIEIQTAEWNINQLPGQIVRGIYETHADAVVFSTYIWNREMVLSVAGEIRKIQPLLLIGFGGPEVSWSARKFFEDCPAADLIIAGEGEEAFVDFLDAWAEGQSVSRIKGIYSRADGFSFGGDRPPMTDLSQIPFPYDEENLDFDPENRIVYYESSRGCPFSCAYCLSSIDKSVRYYPLERVLSEIGYFLERGFPLVKFVDRTFNLDPARYLSIWTYIRDHHNGKTLFHFEIAAEYLSDEAFTLLETIPEGAIQFEIGIQSINSETLRLVGRPAHPEALAEKIRRIPKHIHTHVDLIAGLPAENLASFASSFDYAFALDAGMLQLGFLKILSGSPMERIAESSPGYVWSSRPPYEVLSSPVMPYNDLLGLKDIDRLVDDWYNSGLMRNALNFLVLRADSAFSVFRDLTLFTRSFYPDHDPYLPRRPTDHFACLAAFSRSFFSGRTGCTSVAIEWLKLDFLLQGKPGSFPDWFIRRYSKDAHDAALVSHGISGPGGETRRLAYARTEYEELCLTEEESPQSFLFIYDRTGRERKARFIRV
jgi:hypothetical protein